MFEPKTMIFRDGTAVTTPEMWKKRRGEIRALFSDGMFGPVPKASVPATLTMTEAREDCCAGHARRMEVTIEAQTEQGPFSFPLRLFLPTAPGPHPLMLVLSFSTDAYNRYAPVEEIIDGGFALAEVFYRDITSDDGDFSTGAAPLLGADCGKISLWAWGASRCVDALSALPEIDEKHISVVGHSRLGKSALWCAVNDERVYCACANDSGCAGASLEADKPQGSETYELIARRFPYWFCPAFVKSACAREPQPFDQHLLVAAMAPRRICVGSASRDDWAAPYNEQLSCLGASPAWEIHDLMGYHGPTDPALAGEVFLRGHVGYFLREGTHFLGRRDWNNYMAFVRAHMENEG